MAAAREIAPAARLRQQFSRRAEERRGKGHGEKEKHHKKVDADRRALKMGAENIRRASGFL